MKRSRTCTMLLTLAMAMSAILIVGCGGGEPAPAETAASAPPAATAIPPTPIPDEGDSPVEYAEYENPVGLFSIEYPADWTTDDRSRSDTISIFWYPEELYASASLFLSQLTGIADPQSQMHALIDEWMVDASAFATDDAYEELSREDQADGSVLLRFYYTREDEPTQAGCFFEIQDSLFSALCLGSSEDRWDEHAEILDHMIDSLVVTPPTAEGPGSSYTAYVHPSGVFSIEYPAGWLVEDLSTEGQDIFISFSGESGAFIFAQLVDVGETLNAQGLDDFVETAISSGFGQAQGYQEVSREVQDDGGVLVVFRYIANGELMDVGLLFKPQGSLVSALTIGAPEEVFNSYTGDFNHAGNTFIVDETAWPY
jgi:hypothetical protein